MLSTMTSIETEVVKSLSDIFHKLIAGSQEESLTKSSCNLFFQTKKVGEDILDLLNIKSAKVIKYFNN